MGVPFFFLYAIGGSLAALGMTGIFINRGEEGAICT